jgi:beta-glucosidase
VKGLEFPADFRFGVATSAHQVEGHNVHSDWWEFERRPGAIRDGTHSGAACEHYSRFRDDLDLVQDLSLDSYRFSIEWARIEPRPGEFDHQALDHYAEVIAACRERGLEPFVTLHHFSHPKWFMDRGGWESPDAPEAFARYVRFVGQGLKRQVTHWITINEPLVYVMHAHILGDWLPCRRGFRPLVRTCRNLLRGHFRATRILREVEAAESCGPQIGLAHHLRVFEGLRPGHRLDAAAAWLQGHPFNWVFLDSLERGRFFAPLGVGERIREACPAQDFLGVNYYSRDRLKFNLFRPVDLFGDRLTTPGAELDDMGWEIYPEGMSRVLRTAHARYGKPMWILENGVADAKDTFRPAYLVRHLTELARVVKEGLPVKGYFHWSLLDNFEWTEGFGPRFGLVEVDYQTQERRLRPSAHLYAEIARGTGGAAPVAAAQDQPRLSRR